MYRWEDKFSRDSLERGKSITSKLSSIKESDNQISAKIKDKKTEKISVTFSDAKISSLECSCNYGTPCCHLVALLFYIENNVEKFKCMDFYDRDIRNKVNNIDADRLRDFLFNELLVDDELKSKFNSLYDDGKLLDRDYYTNKLDYIIDCGRTNDFLITGSYDLDVIGDSLYDFLFEDIESLINLGEDSFASELLNDCAFLLQDELTSDSEDWYDCAREYVQCADKILMRNEDNPSELFSSLDDNCYKISQMGL